MDHYKVLGVHKSSTKEEIKHAFRKLAMEFHPDKHSQSSNQLKNSATLKFKQISEAYETLIDDRKRAEYNLKRNAYGYGNHYRHQQGSGYGGGGAGAGGYNYGYSYGSGYGYSGSTRRSGGDGIFTRFEIGFRFLTTKSFLLNATFACVLLGAMVVVDASGQALWKMQNHGKSFQEAMDSLDKSKPGKDRP